MTRWLEMYEVTRRKLNRELDEKELDFLEWLYKKHVLEEMTSSKETS